MKTSTSTIYLAFAFVMALVPSAGAELSSSTQGKVPSNELDQDRKLSGGSGKKMTKSNGKKDGKKG
jgi:hypothetical protein